MKLSESENWSGDESIDHSVDLITKRKMAEPV